MEFVTIVNSASQINDSNKSDLLKTRINELKKTINSGISPKEILKALSGKHRKLYECFDSYTPLSDFDLQPGLSHSKIILVNEPTTMGTLLLEVICFTGEKATTLHLHPEFMVDEVLYGTLREDCYKPIENGQYDFSQTLIRTAGSQRDIFDPDGHPHQVTAEKGPCVCLCLSLGKNDVRSIEDAKNPNMNH
jgi:hypothetical protein